MHLLQRRWGLVSMQYSRVFLHLITMQTDQHLVFPVMRLWFDKPGHLMTIPCDHETLCLLYQLRYSVYWGNE